MKVQNEVFYHISHSPGWSVGSTIYTGQLENEFWEICKKLTITVPVNGRLMSLFAMFNAYDTFDKFSTTDENIEFFYKTLKETAKETSICIREYAFEEVRKEYYPELPSRQKCLWVSRKDDVNYWKTQINIPNRFLLTLELTGDVFAGDSKWLDPKTFSSEEYKERALHYWREEKTSNPQMEYLFSGVAHVKEVVPI